MSNLVTVTAELICRPIQTYQAVTSEEAANGGGWLLLKAVGSKTRMRGGGTQHRVIPQDGAPPQFEHQGHEPGKNEISCPNMFILS